MIVGKPGIKSLKDLKGKKIGIEVDVQIMESNRFWDLQAKKQLPPLFFDGVGDRYQDPDQPLKGIMTSASNWTFSIIALPLPAEVRCRVFLRNS